MEAAIRRRSCWLTALTSALTVLLLSAPAASAEVNDECPPIAEKPDAVDNVEYEGMQELTYCYGPVPIKPGQNIIKFRPAIDDGTKLWPQVPGYITRFDPELVYTDGTVPGVDVVHLHHAVWIVNGNTQFAAGEEKTISQLPEGFGYPSNPNDTWILNDMLHDLVNRPTEVYVVWRLNFVPATSPDAAEIKPVRTKWLDVAGAGVYPVFDSLRGRGGDGEYTFPDEAPPEDRFPCGSPQRPANSHGCIGGSQSWTPTSDVTLIGTAGHLHPGGLNTQLRATRAGQTNTLFTSSAEYFEPAGAVSWDVAMGGTPDGWRVQVKAGDKVTVHTTYDSERADWYEVMGIMPVAVYDGTDVGGKDAMDPTIPQEEALTHGHLAENDNHGGDPTGAPDPLTLWSAPAPNNNIDIKAFAYLGDPNAGPSVPTVEPGQSLTFKSYDVVPQVNAFHTITSCKAPCNASTGVAYPVADGPVTFDSGELGFNGNDGSAGGAPAAGRDTWQTPQDLPSGTYTYFCRIHPFMRGAFRVEKQNGALQTLEAQKKQKLAGAAVSVGLDKPATVELKAKVKGRKPGARSSGRYRVFAQALDTSRSTVALDPSAEPKVKLQFSKSVRKRIKAGLAKDIPWKVVVTATVTDRFGKTATANTTFKLVG
jgi:plastocyanin